MVDGMATKKYTVTLPEELAEAIREQVGPGGFSRYVTQALERRYAHDRLGEAVQWWEEEYGPITEEEEAWADQEMREIRQAHARRLRAEQDRRQEGPGGQEGQAGPDEAVVRGDQPPATADDGLGDGPDAYRYRGAA